VILKVNSAGDTLFSKSVKPTGAITLGAYQISDILPLPDGYLFSGTIGYSSLVNNLLLIKTDTMGNVTWLKSNTYVPIVGFDTGAAVDITKMVATTDGNILVAASASAPQFIKITPDGHELWMRE
jgi:hypothetical protein